MPLTRHAPSTGALRRGLPLLALALAAGMAASGAQARVGIVEIQGQLLTHLSRDDAQALVGRYELADGRQLVVSQRGRQLWASVGDGPELRMQALSATRLRSADGRLTLEFTATANGLVDAVRATMPRRG